MRSTFHILMACLFIGGWCEQIPAQSPTHPSGLSRGDQYHLIFVTSGRRNAFSANIGDYDAFVSAQAELPGSLARGLSPRWFAIASTPTTDAKITTQTDDAPSGLNGLPVYRVDGLTRIADHYDDLWDGNIDAPVLLGQDGRAVLSDAFTGSNQFGVRQVNFTVGDPSGRADWGAPDLADPRWLTAVSIPVTSQLSFYAISDVLTVVPEPSGFVCGILLFVVLRGRRDAGKSLSFRGQVGRSQT